MRYCDRCVAFTAIHHILRWAQHPRIPPLYSSASKCTRRPQDRIGECHVTLVVYTNTRDHTTPPRRRRRRRRRRLVTQSRSSSSRRCRTPGFRNERLCRCADDRRNPPDTRTHARSKNIIVHILNTSGRLNVLCTYMMSSASWSCPGDHAHTFHMQPPPSPRSGISLYINVHAPHERCDRNIAVQAEDACKHCTARGDRPRTRPIRACSPFAQRSESRTSGIPPVSTTQTTHRSQDCDIAEMLHIHKHAHEQPGCINIDI